MPPFPVPRSPFLVAFLISPVFGDRLGKARISIAAMGGGKAHLANQDMVMYVKKKKKKADFFFFFFFTSYNVFVILDTFGELRRGSTKSLAHCNIHKSEGNANCAISFTVWTTSHKAQY